MKDVLGIGWDVGGWCGSKQAVAAVRWKNRRQEWLGKACCFGLTDLPDDWGIEDLIQRTGLEAPEDVVANHDVVLGIDAPLGFPVAFTDLLAARPVQPFDTTELRNNPLAFRETDRQIWGLFKPPLSASFDKLGNNATVAMVHTLRLRAKKQLRVPPFDAVEDGIPTGIRALQRSGRSAAMILTVAAPQESNPKIPCFCIDR